MRVSSTAKLRIPVNPMAGAPRTCESEYQLFKRVPPPRRIFYLLRACFLLLALITCLIKVSWLILFECISFSLAYVANTGQPAVLGQAEETFSSIKNLKWRWLVGLMESRFKQDLRCREIYHGLRPDLGPPWALTRFVFTYFYTVHVFRLILTQVAWLGIFPSSFTATMNGICVSQLRCTSLNNLNSGRYTDWATAAATIAHVTSDH